MADLLKSFLVGNQAQKAQNQAQLEAARKSALEWTKESRAVQGAAEDEYNKLVTMVTGDKWDASMTPIALNLAKNFDTNYGGSWQGKSAQRFVLEALNMGKAKTRQDGGQWQGPPSPGEDVNPLRGTATQAQRDAAKQRNREENIFSAQQGLYSFLQKTAYADNMPIPGAVLPKILEWETKALASGAYDEDELLQITANVRNQYKDIFENLAKAGGTEQDYREEMNRQTAVVERHVKSLSGMEAGLIDAFGFDGAQQFFAEMGNFGRSMVGIGASDAYITSQIDSMAMLRAKDPEALPMDLYRKSVAKIPPAGWEKIESVYNNEVYWEPESQSLKKIEPGAWLPSFNEETGEVGLVHAVRKNTGRPDSYIYLWTAPVDVSGLVPGPEQKQEEDKPRQQDEPKGTKADGKMGQASMRGYPATLDINKSPGLIEEIRKAAKEAAKGGGLGPVRSR
jgi:hypothetical protein